MRQLDHVGIVVKDLDEGIETYSKILGGHPYREEIVQAYDVKVAFFHTGQGKVELLSPLTQESILSGFLEKFGEGLHHMAFLSEDIGKDLRELVSQGFEPIDKEPVLGARNHWVAFVHPKLAHDTLIELCQPIPEPGV